MNDVRRDPRCSSTSPGDFPPIYCILKHGHDGGHIGADGGEWFSSIDTPLVQRLEMGIAATVREIDELRAENTRLRTQLSQSGITTLHTDDHLKTVREALCVAQAAIGNFPNRPLNWPQHIPHLQRLINDIDRQRPIGSNGKHGNLHTPTCQCQDIA